MSHLLNAFNSRIVMRLALAGITAALLAGCSSDASRLTNPFGNPFSENVDPLPTRSIPRPAAPVGPVSARPLAALPARVAAQATPRVAYNQPPALAADVTGSIVPHGLGKSGLAGWSADGGTPIVAAQGESAAMLARRYGVPEASLLSVNGFSAANQVQPGTRLIVPVYNAGQAGARPAPVAQAVPAPMTPRPQKPVAALKPQAAKADVAEADAPEAKPVKKAKPQHAAKPEPVKLAAAKPVDIRPVPLKPVAAKVAVVKPVATKPVVAQAVAVKPKIAKVENAKPDIKKPAIARVEPPVAAKAMPVKIAKIEPAPAPVAPAPVKPAPVKTARNDKPVIAEQKKPVVDASPVASLPPAAAPASDAANPEFRWPARGRIIQGFKAGGNDGINIAVPEGTSVKAAEGGVVAYAGSELKGYGNLVLIRHPNGFVSAYANNGDIEVKRGDNVKRGQTIAKSGQSGNVSSPQLHFELRKGATPVDPTGYLAGL